MASVDRVLGGIRNALILGILILPIGCYGSNQDRPSISSFQADPTTIKNGETSELTAIFDNGNGLVVPGYFYRESVQFACGELPDVQHPCRFGIIAKWWPASPGG
jgi:hypothetical protein